MGDCRAGGGWGVLGGEALATALLLTISLSLTDGRRQTSASPATWPFPSAAFLSTQACKGQTDQDTLSRQTASQLLGVMRGALQVPLVGLVKGHDV